VPQLVEFFLDKYNRKMSKRATIGDDVLEAMINYDYPGNIRELENMVEQAVALSTADVVTLDDVLPPAPKRMSRAAGKTLADIVDDAEREAVETALRAHDGSRERAAEALNISPTTLWRKMTRLGISFDAKDRARKLGLPGWSRGDEVLTTNFDYELRNASSLGIQRRLETVRVCSSSVPMDCSTIGCACCRAHAGTFAGRAQ